MEIWKKISFNERYEVSNFGKVRNARTKRLLKPKEPRRNHGQLVVYLYRYRNYKEQFTLSQIVYNHFTKKDEEKPTYYWANGFFVKNNRIGHLDENVRNNKWDNLYRY